MFSQIYTKNKHSLRPSLLFSLPGFSCLSPKLSLLVVAFLATVLTLGSIPATFDNHQCRAVIAFKSVVSYHGTVLKALFLPLRIFYSDTFQVYMTRSGKDGQIYEYPIFPYQVMSHSNYPRDASTCIFKYLIVLHYCCTERCRILLKKNICQNVKKKVQKKGDVLKTYINPS